MKKIYAGISILICLSFSIASSAQLVEGDIAPDWTFDDIDGNEHNLYSLLDQGKTVIIDASATWCYPCWQYHTSGELETIYDEFGPEGTDQVSIFMIEADDQTNLACLMDDPGCNSTTQGDWVTGTPYPIINPGVAATNNFISEYDIAFYPILYVICPDHTIQLASAFDFETGTGQYIFSADEILEAMDQNCAVPVIEMELEGISLYPNPATDMLTISTQSINEREITIFDLVGNIAFQQSFANNTSLQLTIDISVLSAGVYTVVVNSRKSISTQKLVVQR
jgi:hypothetical protein